MQRKSQLRQQLGQYIKQEDLKVLLQSRGLATQGSFEELLSRSLQALKAEHSGVWVWERNQIPDIPDVRISCSLVARGLDIYLFGGYDQSAVPRGSLWRYTPGSPSWEVVTVAGQPLGYSAHVSVLLGNKLWLLGSVIVGIGKREFELQMISLTDFQHTRYPTSGELPHECIQRGLDLEAIAWQDGVLVCCIDGVLHLSLRTFEWTTLFPSPKPENSWWQSFKATLQDDSLLMFGWGSPGLSANDMQEGHTSDLMEAASSSYGCIHSTLPALQMWRMDLATQKWARVPHYGHEPSWRERFPATRMGDLWLVHGGVPLHRPQESHDDAFTLNLASMVWTKLESEHRVQPRCCHGAACVGDTVVYAGGRVSWGYAPTRSLSTPCMAVAVLRRCDIQQPHRESTQGASFLPSDADESLPPSRRTTLSELPYVGDQTTSQPRVTVGGRPFDLVELCGSEHLSDIVLHVDGRDIPAHRLVLAASSAVFRRLFANPMAEQGASELKIPNFSFPAFYHVLRHMYGMPLDVEHEHHVEVLTIADYYALTGLKSEVELQLLQHVEVDNACDLWLLAYTQDCPDLRAAVVKLCAEKWADVCQTEGYQSLAEGARLVLDKRVRQERSAEEADLRLAAEEKSIRPGSSRPLSS